MRRAEGRPLHEPVPGREDAGDRVDPRHLERLLLRQRRKDPRQPAREHRLPRPGRAAEEDVVAARRGDLERAPGALLAADVAEVGLRRCRRRRPARPEARPERARSGRRPPGPGARPGRPRSRPGTPRTPTPERREAARARPPARPRRPRSRRAPGGCARRGRARRERRARRDARRAPAACAARTASAIGRSKPEPSFFRPAGARLTVIRLRGHSSSTLLTALRTRSFASWHALSGRPTIANAGSAALEVRLDLDRPRVDPDEGVSGGAREHLSRLGSRGARNAARRAEFVPELSREARARSAARERRRPRARRRARRARAARRARPRPPAGRAAPSRA